MPGLAQYEIHRITVPVMSATIPSYLSYLKSSLTICSTPGIWISLGKISQIQPRTNEPHIFMKINKNVLLYTTEILWLTMHSGTQSCLTLCDPMNCSPPGSSPQNFPGKNTGVDCHFFLQVNYNEALLWHLKAMWLHKLLDLWLWTSHLTNLWVSIFKFIKWS